MIGLHMIVFNVACCVLCAGGEETGAISCEKGFSGIMCTVCEPGYYQSSSEGCTACHDGGINLVAILVIFIGVVAVLYVLFLACGARILSHFSKHTGLSFFSKAWRSKTMNFQARKKNFLKSENMARNYQNKLKQLVTMFQILSALPSTLSFTYPDVFYKLTFIFKLIDFGKFMNELGLSCSVDGLDYVSTVITATLVPIAVSLLLYLIQGVHVYFTLHQYSEPFREIANTYHRIRVLKSTYFYIFLFFTYLILPSVCTVLFGMLRPCVDMDPEGVEEGSHDYLEADYSIECSSDRYRLGRAWAAVFVCVYPLGIPCMYFYLLYQARRLIKSRANIDVDALNEAGLQEMEETATTLSSLGFLFHEYQPKVSMPAIMHY